MIGGAHGDLPLDAAAGPTIADLVVEERIPVVLSLRHLSKTAQRRFVAEFCERLYHRKGEDRHRLPLHVVIDEADAFVPQRVMSDTARVMGAVDDLVRRGRSSGIGVTLITQRASVIHKDVLTQIEVLIALRTVSPQDRKAIETWIEAHDPEDQGREVLASLASLPVGTAWVWSPGWLELLQQVQVRRRRTFDSSATPKMGDQPVEPRAFATVDLAALQDRLAAAVEEAEANDPKVLRQRIAELERQVREHPVPAPVERIVERTPRVLIQHLEATAIRLATIDDEVQALLALLAILIADRQPDHQQEPTPVQAAPRPKPTPSPLRVAPYAGTLRKGERAMLQALARLDRPLTRTQLGTLAGFVPGGGTFGTYLGVLKRHGFIEEQHGGLTITPAGLAELGDTAPSRPQTTAELLDLWRNRLRAGERRMLDVLVDAYPGEMTREDLGGRTGFTVSGGTFSTYLGVLRRNGLIEVDGGAVRASGTLFLN